MAAKFQNKYLFSEYIPKRNESLCPPKDIYKNGPKSQKLGITQMCIHRRMGE